MAKNKLDRNQRIADAVNSMILAWGKMKEGEATNDEEETRLWLYHYVEAKDRLESCGINLHWREKQLSLPGPKVDTPLY